MTATVHDGQHFVCTHKNCGGRVLGGWYACAPGRPAENEWVPTDRGWVDRACGAIGWFP